MKTDQEKEKRNWSEYCEKTLSKLSPIVEKLGYTLGADQPHLLGERFLIRPIAGGRKLVLVGHRISDGAKVVIKASDEKYGIAELARERLCRNTLEKMRFAYQVFHSPKELAFVRRGGFTIVVTEFIEQDSSFISRPVEKEFALVLAAFKAQEGARATTYKHKALVVQTFGEMTAADYYKKAKLYIEDIVKLISNEEIYPELVAALAHASAALRDNQERLDQYGGFLTHWDFTPQNFRVRDNTLYLLDHSSLRFGNKYEGWARFINFMALYNPALAQALLEYVRINRTPEESESLKLMRIFRLIELIRYYASWLPRTAGDLHKLTSERIRFWTSVLCAVLDDKKISQEKIDAYTRVRGTLRSEDEKHRQKDLH